MKGNALLIALLVVLTSCNNTTEQQSKKSGEEIWFEKNTYDYGEIVKGSDGLYTIEFKNLGKEPIIINRVRSSCGCTIPSWPREPIAAGSSGELEVKYNTALVGPFMKSIHVYSTASNSPVKITIKGRVISEDTPGSEADTD